MLPFDFDYYKPSSLKEAIGLFNTLKDQGYQPMYISGGTELITLGRIDLLYTDAVIDLKDIEEAKSIEFDDDYLVLGSALTLTQIEEANLFPLLTRTSSEIADHTARGKITLGGNICAQIFYREAVLPFLLADSQVVIAGHKGITVTPINQRFHEQLQFNSGEFLVQIATERQYIEAPFFTFKRRQQWETGYPLITVAALKIAGKIRIAISGLCPFPFRSTQMEEAINQNALHMDARADQALKTLPAPILNDVEGSDQYRLFVLRHLLLDVMDALESV